MPESLQVVPVNVTCACIATLGREHQQKLLVVGTCDRALHVFELNHTEGGSVGLCPLWERNLPGQARDITSVRQPGEGAVILIGLSTGCFVVVGPSKKLLRYARRLAGAFVFGAK